MKDMFITITGTQYRFGTDFIKPDMMVDLVKEPDNEFDSEAIKVTLPGLGTIGYVANSPRTVLGESMSAGRLYDKIGEVAIARVLYVLPQGVICQVEAECDCEEQEDR